MEKRRREIINVPSLLVEDAMNQKLFRIMGRNCRTLASAVVQVFLAKDPKHEEWTKLCCGVATFIKDNGMKSYFIRVFNLTRDAKVFEQKVCKNFAYSTPRSYFHTFNTQDCPAALNFVIEEEASHFKDIIQAKLRQSVRKKRERLRLHPVLKALIDEVGISETELASSPTLQGFICNFIEENGGVDVIKEEMEEEERQKQKAEKRKTQLPSVVDKGPPPPPPARPNRHTMPAIEPIPIPTEVAPPPPLPPRNLNQKAVSRPHIRPHSDCLPPTPKKPSKSVIKRKFGNLDTAEVENPTEHLGQNSAHCVTNTPNKSENVLAKRVQKTQFQKPGQFITPVSSENQSEMKPGPFGQHLLKPRRQNSPKDFCPVPHTKDIHTTQETRVKTKIPPPVAPKPSKMPQINHAPGVTSQLETDDIYEPYQFNENGATRAPPERYEPSIDDDDGVDDDYDEIYETLFAFKPNRDPPEPPLSMSVKRLTPNIPVVERNTHIPQQTNSQTPPPQPSHPIQSPLSPLKPRRHIPQPPPLEVPITAHNIPSTTQYIPPPPPLNIPLTTAFKAVVQVEDDRSTDSGYIECAVSRRDGHAHSALLRDIEKGFQLKSVERRTVPSRTEAQASPKGPALLTNLKDRIKIMRGKVDPNDEEDDW